MKRIANQMIVLGICTVIIHACSVSQDFIIQSLNPAQIKLGQEIDRIELVNNSQKELYTNVPDSLNNEESLKLIFLASLQEELKRSPLLSNTTISFLEKDSLLLKMSDLNYRVASRKFLIYIDSIRFQELILTKDLPNKDENMYALATSCQLSCKLFRMNDLGMEDYFILHDTVYWTPFIDFYLMQTTTPPAINTKTIDIGTNSALEYAHRLAPYWSNEQRFLFSKGSKTLKTSAYLIMNNQLDSASRFCASKLENPPSNRLAYLRLLHNYAVVSEMTDHFDEAIEAEEKCLSLKKNAQVKEYLNILRRRKIDKIALDWQLTN